MPGAESTAESLERAIKTEASGYKQKKDDVQTRDEGFPHIWLWENLTRPDKTGGEITSGC